MSQRVQALDDAALAGLELLDHRGTDWSRVRRTAYLLHQHVRYDYTGPVHDVRQRLVLVPPARHGDQRRLGWRVRASDPRAVTRSRTDGYGNLVVEIGLDHVEDHVEFEAWTAVERRPAAPPHRTPPDRRLLEATPLTTADAAIRAAAAELAAAGEGGLALAERICTWVHGAMTYGFGVTEVETPAAEALAGGRGVCQDDAHIMLALCREVGLPARYVSGHLLGEGGSHAWVEVLVPSQSRPGRWDVTPFDPCHGRRTDLGYVTVAVGRDYRDVAPTSGTYEGPHQGVLTMRKRAGLTAVEG